MSGPVGTSEELTVADGSGEQVADLEVRESRTAEVGAFQVRRALPQRTRRTVGAWCFADHMGPADIDETSPLIGPHPHIGLATVTWLLDGELLHRDSLGSEQVIRPGQLNLMSAGNAVVHSEESTGSYRGALEGIQLWVAQPDATRTGAAAFEHHSTLPQVELDQGVGTVLVGDYNGVRSPARADSPLLGLDLDVHGANALALRADWEHAFVVLRGELTVGTTSLTPGRLGYLGQGHDEVELDSPGARALLLGGEPFAEGIVMWWNFVARTRDELDAAYRSWSIDDDRFGRVRSPMGRIVAPQPYWSS
jgi:quercetin 2,3-dioxygenase